MHPVMASRHRSSGGGGGFSYSFVGSVVSPNNSSVSLNYSSISLQPGDLMVVSYTYSNTATIPTGWTTIYSNTSSSSYIYVGYRLFQSGDSSISFGGSAYGTLSICAFRKSTGVATLDTYSSNIINTGFSEITGSISNTAATASTTTDLALMIFANPTIYGMPASPVPAYTAIPTNYPTYALAVTWTNLSASGSFSGTACGVNYRSSYPAFAILALFK